MNKSKIKYILFIIFALIVIILCITVGKNIYLENKLRNAKIVVKLKYDELNVYEEYYLEDIIEEINGILQKNIKIDTTILGEKEINFKYKNEDNIIIPYTIKVNIVDKTPPIISLKKKMTIYKGTTDFKKEIFCGDNYDDEPKCTIEGDYNTNNIGEYNLIFKGEDSSKNISTNEFTLNVIEKPKNSNSSGSNSQELNGTKLKDVINEYKNNKNKIGIDVSHWQGNINFEKVKESGVEFAYIRVGRADSIGDDFVLDDKFIQNIEGFNKVGIPVGVYFYSSANSEKTAKKEAKWLLSQIKKYKVDLEIVFDWENWDEYQEYKVSFYNLTKSFEAFSDYVQKHGYEGMLYSSKNYLENIWYPTEKKVWLAHYTKQTDYQGKYKVWQICSDGVVEGINDNLVDIDIMYN